MDAPVWDAVAPPDIRCPPLPLLLSLLAGFHQQNIVYCYWKSGRRVAAALSGESDLDLLVARKDQHRAREILLARGFKFFPAVAGRDNPAIASVLGYDPSSSRIIHVHLHVRLVVGEPLLKEYRLPWEAAILARAIVHPELSIRVLDPADEALLMVVRSCLELRRADPVALRGWATMRRKFALDREWLATRLDRTALRGRAREVFTDDLAERVTEAVFGGRALGSERRLRRRIRAELSPWRACNAIEARLRGCARAAFWAAGGLNDRLLHLPRPWRRRAPGGGCVVALLGVDGSGKTTVVAAIRAWLGSEVDVVPIYFGTGGGRPSLLLLPFKLMLPLVAPFFSAKPRGASHGRVSDRPPGVLYSALMMTWAGVLSVEKRVKLLAARRGADRGLVVLADRYPQNEDPRYNDGPLLSRLNWAPRWLRGFEARAYALARRLPPDLVVRLEVTPETAARREPDMDLELIRSRVAALRRLTFPGACEVSVDAERPLADVLGAVKHAIWHML